MQHPDYTVDRKSAPSGDALCNYLISVRKHGLFKLRGRYLLSVEFDHDAAIQALRRYEALSSNAPPSRYNPIYSAYTARALFSSLTCLMIARPVLNNLIWTSPSSKSRVYLVYFTLP